MKNINNTPITRRNKASDPDVLASQLADIATNALQHGIKGDGTDETVAINNLLATYKNVFFPKPPVSYTISDTLNITNSAADIRQGMKIEFAQGAILKQTANKPALKITGSGHKVKTPIIDVSAIGSSFTASLVLLYSDSSSLPCTYNRITEITLLQSTKTGVAIELQTINSGYAYYNNVTGTVQYFYNGIKINSNSTNQINNNHFDVNINSAQQTLYVESLQGNLGGNVFNGACQVTQIDNTNTERAAVYVHNAAQNIFNMMLFDVGASGLIKWGYEFNNCGFNIVNNTSSRFIKITNGLDNTNIIVQSSDQIKNRNVSLPFRGDWDIGNSYTNSFQQLDEYYSRYYSITPMNNTLANLKNLSSISVNTSDCVLHPANTMTNLNDLLNHNALTYLRYKPNDSTLGGTVDVIITLNSAKKIRTFGCIKGYTDSGKLSVLGYYWDTTNNVWVQCSDLFPTDSSNNKSGHLFNCGATTTQLKLSFVIPANSVLTYGYFLTLHYIFANIVGLSDGGSAYPYIGGDQFTGDLSFATGYSVKTGAITTLPTADSTQRGKFIRIEGSSGVADGIYICAKLSDNTYIWKSIGHDANTTANRPTTNLYIGRRYFDTTLGKPIWLKQVSPAAWVDATGTTI